MKFTNVCTVFVFLILITAGCQTTNAPYTPSETWTPSSRVINEQSTDFVWAKIREQKIDTSKPFTLIQLVDIALKNSPSTRQAWEGARASEAVQGQAQSTYYPSANVSAVVNKQKISGSLEVNDLDELNYTPNVTLSYLLLDFGGRRANLDQAYQTLLSSNFQFNQSIQDLVLNVSTKYCELYSARSVVESAMADLLDAKTALNAAVQKFNVGLVTKVDVLQARSNFDKALFSFEDSKGKLKTAEANIANVLGLPADTKIDIVEPVKDISKDIVKRINKKNISDVIEAALKKRPDIAAGISSLRAKEAAVRSANSDLWPTLNAQGSTQKDWYDYYNTYNGDFSNKDDYQYSAYLSVNWDIFNGFNNINKKKEAEALLAKERENLRLTELNASADVWSRYYDFRTAVQKLTAGKAYLNSSKSSYDLTLQSYDAGLKNILDLLTAQSQLSQARSSLIQSRRDLFVALASLGHATGALNTQQISEEVEQLTK